MARHNQEAIETFMSITGASEEIAEQKLEEHGGDLNEAVNAHFTEGDGGAARNARVLPVSTQGDFMDIDDDPVEIGPWGPPPSRLPAAAGMSSPFSLFDPNFRRSLFDPTAELTSSEPFVTHPREVRQIPIEVKDDENQPSGPSGVAPVLVEDVTETVRSHVPRNRGTVIIDGDEDDDDEEGLVSHGGQKRDVVSVGGPSALAPPRSEDLQYNDVEEQMIRAAIEASKREVAESLPNQHFDVDNDLINPGIDHAQSEDPYLAHAVSLSLKEQSVGSSSGESKPAVVEQGSNAGTTNGRLEPGSSFVHDEVEDVDEQPLVRHRSRRTGSVGSEKDDDVLEDITPPLSPRRPVTGGPSNPERNGDAFHSEDWGGLSSLEHDEAVMLEAAMFGGIPEETRYRFPYAPHQMMRPEGGQYPRPMPRPPSPNLTAQRLIREQQDDEYLASLQADREKEQKAREETEARLEEERIKEEESQKKLEEEKELEGLLAAKEAALPQEPASNDEQAVNLLVRMPDGSRRGRRFLKSDNLQSLFDYMDIGRVVKPGSYRLVRPYPRRAFEEGESGLTLSDLGLTSKQEALYLELV